MTQARDKAVPVQHNRLHQCLLCSNQMVILFNGGSFQSLYFAWWKASSGISLASSGLLASPTRSCDSLDNDHVTAVVHSSGVTRTPGCGACLVDLLVVVHAWLTSWLWCMLG